ncbi:GM17837 [Drosophila sechellia]|uniref:GM17837 n=1 Tax=Drosophila sechellia TaxID=7238 RepID=B4IJK8_DROSE|nr:GM17837 [Drosophila sechellia]
MPEQEGPKKDMLSNSPIFKTEILMYSKALPELERILREAGDTTNLYVPYIYHSLEPHQVMIFEDLVPQGYTVIRDRFVNKEELKNAYFKCLLQADECSHGRIPLKPRQVLIFEDLVPQGYFVIRDRPMKLNEYKNVFSKLAKWHAVSMKVLNEQPEILKDFKYGLMEMPTIMSDPMVTTGMENFLKIMDQIPELTKYKPHFEKIKDNYMQRMGDVMQEYRKNIQSDGYYVMCHGDFHARNLMFKENEEVMLVDFQICNLCPITIDLSYSVYMLMEPEQRWDLGKDLINFYFSVLEDTLKKVGYKGKMPTNDGLWKQIHRHKFYVSRRLTI